MRFTLLTIWRAASARHWPHGSWWRCLREPLLLDHSKTRMMQYGAGTITRRR
jgi:hypothetical protein